MLPEHKAWAERLIIACRKEGLTRSEWREIGEQMHIIDGDYRWLYKDRWDAAYPEMKAMWDVWEQAKPKVTGADHES